MLLEYCTDQPVLIAKMILNGEIIRLTGRHRYLAKGYGVNAVFADKPLRGR